VTVHQRALVTGGAGVIGSHLVDALLGRGAKVTVLDNFSTGRAENLGAHERSSALRVIKGDVADAEVVRSAVHGQDVIYHLAAAVGVKNIVDDPLGSMYANVRGAENVLNAASPTNTPVLLASSSEIYGRNTAVPFSEDSDRVLGPTWIHRWSYSTAKAIDEHLGFAHATKGLSVTIVRYFNAYGPRLRESGYGSVIARFASQALRGVPITVHGDGKQTRCFTYISDVVEGTILAAETPAAYGSVFNIGSDEEHSINEVAEIIKAQAGSHSTIQHVSHESYYGPGFEDTHRRVPNTRKARDVLGFSAGVAFTTGLSRTLDWCRQNYMSDGFSR
jgi:UDP-glucose 4-epimerase